MVNEVRQRQKKPDELILVSLFFIEKDIGSDCVMQNYSSLVRTNFF